MLADLFEKSIEVPEPFLEDATNRLIVDLVVAVHQDIPCSCHGRHECDRLPVENPGFPEDHEDTLVILWFPEPFLGDDDLCDLEEPSMASCRFRSTMSLPSRDC